MKHPRLLLLAVLFLLLSPASAGAQAVDTRVLTLHAGEKVWLHCEGDQLGPFPMSRTDELIYCVDLGKASPIFQPAAPTETSTLEPTETTVPSATTAGEPDQTDVPTATATATVTGTSVWLP